MEKQTPEEFYKDTYGEDPPKKFDTSSSAYIFSFAAAYANHVNKPNKEELEKAFNAGYGYRASIRDIVREPEFKEWHNQNIEK